MSIMTHIRLLKKKRTKIVATLGPASEKPEIIRELVNTGVNIFRLNMSHGNHDSHRRVFERVRDIASEINPSVAVLADLCGPKIRTGKFQNGSIQLEKGKRVVITTRDVIGDTGLIPSRYTALAGDVTPGNRILLNDGLIELRVLGIDDTEITCEVIYGGLLSNHKGINLPGVNISAPSLTEKDREDARFALELGVDFLALSFVRRASDIKELKDLIIESNRQASIIAKIEKPEALEDIDAIVDAADAIMVARGDLGVELNPEQVPVAQGQLIDRSRARFKPVIVATQMLESMIESSRPTRAEVTDISHAVTLGTDAVMLSAETASGAYPVEAVKMMDRIIRQTESWLWQQGAYGHTHNSGMPRPIPVWNVMADATATVSRDLMAHAVMVISKSGMSAATISSARPAAPVVAITETAEICRRMSLLWSVIPILDEESGREEPAAVARRLARELNLAEPGESVLLIRGFHSDPELNAPSITVITV